MDSGLCEYRDAFGRPGEGAHAIRIGGLAAVDLGLTVAAAYFATRGKGLGAFLLALIVLVVVGIIAHVTFCVNTQLNAWIFGRPYGVPTAA